MDAKFQEPCELCHQPLVNGWVLYDNSGSTPIFIDGQESP
jgi:hypothetical protein